MAVADDFFRVLVAQLVDGKTAAFGDHQGFGQQIGRVEPRQPQPAAQVALAIGKQRVAGVENRGFQAQGGQCVLHWPAGAHVHVHIARGNQRQATGGAEGAQFGQPGGIIRPGMQFNRQPAATGKARRQPLPVLDRRQRARHPEHDAVRYGAVG